MNDFLLIMPEIFLALTLAFVIFGEITYHGEQRRLIGATALMGLAAAFLQTVLSYQYGASQVFSHALSVDGLSLFFKLLFIVLAALAIITASHTKEIPSQKQPEYSALVLASALAMCLSAAAAEMILAFLCLQCVNVLAYFIAGFGKKSALSTEAAIKYMIFNAAAAAFFLYGLAILFTHTHSLNIYEMHRALVANPLPRNTMLVVFVLNLLFFSFQFASFPMYFWAPDVLEGAPTPASSFLSLGTRIAGMAVSLRFLIVVFAQPDSSSEGRWQVLGAVDWTQILALVAALTMLVGALLSIRQKGAKRMVGYLAIAQTGFLLMGILVLDQLGIAALLYSLVIELFALTGIYYVLSYFHDEIQSDRFSDLRGIMGKSVPECICLVLFLLSLIGIPPMPGFVAKFTLIGAAVRHGWLVLAGVAVVSTGLSTIAAAQLIYGLMGDLRETIHAPFQPSRERAVFLAGLILPMFFVGVLAEYVLGWAGKSLGFILW